MRQEALLPGSVLRARRRSAKLLLPYLMQPECLGSTERLCGLLDDVGIDTLLGQLKAHTRCAIPGPTATGDRFGKTLIREQSLGHQLIKNLVELILTLGQAREFLMQLCSGVFPSSEGRDGPYPKGG